MQFAAGAHALELLVDFLDAPGNSAAVGFELCFARASRADSAAQPRHLDTVAGQPRQHIVELRQFDLQTALPRAGAPGEDVEDELGAIDNFYLKLLLEIPLLGRREVLIENDDRRAGGRNRRRQLANLTRADQRRGFDPL